MTSWVVVCSRAYGVSGAIGWQPLDPALRKDLDDARDKLKGAMAARSPTREERRLAKGLRRRDPAALEELHALCARATFGLLLRMLRDRAEAEDVFQVVFLQAWEQGDRYDPRRASPLTWVLNIARSRAIDQLRRRIPEPREPAGAIAMLDREGGDAGTDDLLEQWRMAALLERLPTEEAGILRARFHQGLSQSEIAERSGIPLGTVKMRMVQGLDRLRGLIEAEAGRP